MDCIGWIVVIGSCLSEKVTSRTPFGKPEPRILEELFVFLSECKYVAVWKMKW